MEEKILDKKIHYWEDQLLDLGKRNKMISFRESKRATLKILKPGFDELYQSIVTEEQELTFQKSIDRDSDVRVYSILELLNHLSVPIEVNIGDIRAEGTLSEIKKTLKHLRSKARLAIDEQGTNILYLVFGFIEWREKGNKTNDFIKSPLLLVPVTLTLPSLNAQYSLKKTDDEIVVNPTLAYLFERDFGITLPEFDSDRDSLSSFMSQMEKLVEDRGWRILRQTSIGLVSFLKISMYNDLLKNEEALKENAIIRAFAGEENEVSRPAGDVFQFDHDTCRAIDSYQVMDADSSQQDAIVLSQRGVSFVMQGPPGTGKSQTITNIIAQGLADGKKILFVSEKMAALDVVYRRLTDVHLDDFCLSLHSHKANKKEILVQLEHSLNLKQYKVKNEEIEKLTQLDMIREQLGTYVKDIHTVIMPLEMTFYEVYGEILRFGKLPDIDLDIQNPEKMTKDQVNRLALMVQDLERAQAVLGPQWYKNPWHDVTGSYLEVSQKRDLQNKLQDCLNLISAMEECKLLDSSLADVLTLSGFDGFVEMYNHARCCAQVPHCWFSRTTEQERKLINLLRKEKRTISELNQQLSKDYDQGYFELNGIELLDKLSTAISKARSVLRHASSDDEAFERLHQDEEFLEKLQNITAEIREVIGSWMQAYDQHMPETIETFRRILQISDMLQEKRNLTISFFDIEFIRTFVNETRSFLRQLNEIRTTLTERYSKKVLTLENPGQYLAQIESAGDVCSRIHMDPDSDFALLRDAASFDMEKVERIEEALSSDILAGVAQNYHAPLPLTVNECTAQIKAISLLPHLLIPDSWKQTQKRKDAAKLIADAENYHKEFIAARDYLSEKFKQMGIAAEICDITQDFLYQIELAHELIPEPEHIIKCCDDFKTYELLDQIEEKIQSGQDVEDEISNFRTECHILSSLAHHELLASLKKFYSDACKCHPTRKWAENITEVRNFLQQLSQLSENLKKQRTAILETCEASVFDIDADGMLDRFKADYTSFFKIFKKSYKDDLKQIRLSYREVRKKISDEEIIELLQKLKQYHEEIQKYQSYAPEVAQSLSVDHYDIDYRWEAEEARLDLFADFSKLFDSGMSAYSFISEDKWDLLIKKLSENQELQKWFEDLTVATESFGSLYQGRNTDTASIRKALNHARKQKMLFVSPESYIAYVNQDDVPDQILKQGETLLNAQRWFVSNSDAIEVSIGKKYTEGDTQWAEIAESLDRYKQVVKVFGEQAASELADGYAKDCSLIDAYADNLKILEQVKNCALELGLYESERSDIGQKKISDILADLGSAEGDMHTLLEVYEAFSAYNEKYTEISIAQLERDLRQIQQYQQSMVQFPAIQEKSQKVLGTHYNGFETDWEAVEANICFCETAVKIMGDQMTEELKNAFIMAESPFTDLQLMDLHEMEKQTANIEAQYPEIAFIQDLNRKNETITVVRESLLQAIEIKDLIHQNAFLDCSYFDLVNDLKNLSILQKSRLTYENHLSEAQKLMPVLQLSLDTDWEVTADMFEHMRLLKRMLDADAISEEVSLWLTNGIPSKPVSVYSEIIDRFSRHKDDFLFTTHMFANHAQLDGYILTKLQKRIEQCNDAFETMDAWIDFRDCRKLCEDNGLKDFLLQAEDKYIPAGTLKDVFLKSFYYEWFEKTCAGVQSVSDFRVRAQNARIETFRELDDRQLPADQLRIREKLIQNIPTTHTSGRAEDEMSVLLHEIGKKRNIMPLRKLFRTIPNLLLRLKPCLMMSPLSVSYFLEATTYKFDMVIFDEASQIFPQDAIGSIFRGSQVIIAGDSKQLPPTNFFAASTNIDGDYDIEDDDEEDTIYDSILEEASDKLPNRSLLWHYRSRFEELISFSNQEIYQNNLITFPSSKINCSDSGVEFIHVANGIYENRCNRREAQEIVKLVDEHIRNHPERSLGIIAFSESQQSVIEDEINKYRAKNPFREQFFDEEKEEPFFVKNLENVQGDERDTIIFSICYGKNAQGRMYMRFGPLGNQGGERRLNVAITRAKKNVKLVSSIWPEDIDLSKTKSEGVRMLRSYIIFAIQGNTALLKHAKKNSLYDEDLFSEQVGKFLERSGCKVQMNVGSSDYTVDIAVEHPKQPGEFIAGIECDGNSYYMARTVRDRDHLRTAVMERMGWKMYRVWSTEWIRNPEAEQERLLEFIRNALLTYGQKDLKPQNEAKEDNILAVEVVETPKKTAKVDINNPYNLPEYIEGNCFDYKPRKNYSELQKTAAMIKTVVEVEQPLHMELLYKRISVGIADGRVTSAVRYAVDRAISTYLLQEVVIADDFISMTSLKTVQARRSPAGAKTRTIEQISIPEIAAAMEKILEGAIGIEKSVLGSETASIFGFERFGSKIRERTEEALNYLIKAQKVSLVDNKVQLMEG